MTLTLPSDWVKKLNLKAGDELDLTERDNTLMINGYENLKDKCTIIDITDFTVPLLWRFFQGAYRSGCDEIKITFNPDKKFYEDVYHYYTTQFDYTELGEKMPQKSAIAMIQGLVDRFIGLGITETGKNYCIIKEMGEITTKEFENSLRRIFLVILHMFDRMIAAIKNDEIKNVDLCKEFHTIDLNIDRLVDYCCRILNKINTSFSESKKMLLFSTLYILELIGDEFKYIGRHLALTKKTVKDTLPLAEMVKEHFNCYYELFYKFNREAALKFGKSDFDTYSKHFKVKDELRRHSRSIARHFMLISKLTLALAELKIEMEF